MRDDYNLKGKTVRLDGVEVEIEVSEQLSQMESYSKLTRSEITNTALKRFIAHHRDFLSPEDRSTSKKSSLP